LSFELHANKDDTHIPPEKEVLQQLKMLQGLAQIVYLGNFYLGHRYITLATDGICRNFTVYKIVHEFVVEKYPFMHVLMI